MKVSIVSLWDASSPLALSSEVSVFRSSTVLPCVLVRSPIRDVNDGFLPVVGDFNTEAVLEVSPIRSIFPPPFNQKILRCEETGRGSFVRVRIDQEAFGLSSSAVVVPLSSKKEVSCGAIDAPSIIHVSSPQRESFDWVERRMYGLEKS